MTCCFGDSSCPVYNEPRVKQVVLFQRGWSWGDTAIYQRCALGGSWGMSTSVCCVSHVSPCQLLRLPCIHMGEYMSRLGVPCCACTLLHTAFNVICSWLSVSSCALTGQPDVGELTIFVLFALGENITLPTSAVGWRRYVQSCCGVIMCKSNPRLRPFQNRVAKYSKGGNYRRLQFLWRKMDRIPKYNSLATGECPGKFHNAEQ